ncbi:MAG: amidohydrolase [Gemmataceae bacterium]
MALSLFFAPATIVSGHPVTNPKVFANLVLVNAKIWTVDGDHPEVEALAAWQGRILAVGTNAEMRALAGPKTVVLDGKGRRVLPGLHDSHLHLLGGGLRLNQVALKDAKDLNEFGQRLTEFDQKLPRHRWITGGGWDHDRTLAGKLPSAADIDRFVADRPVFLRRYDGHMALANSKALSLANISAGTADPAGGQIDREPGTNRVTGILRDNAMALVEAIIPKPDEAEIIEGVRGALAAMRQAGITSCADMEGSATPVRRILLRVYQQMARAGELMCRVEVRLPIAEWKELAALPIQANFGNDYFRIGGVKGYMDGSLGSNTAKMFAPYLNDPNTTGLFVTSRDQMLEYVQDCDRAGLSIAVHAIGDEANAAMLDICDAVRNSNGPRDRRIRIEHSQHLRPQDIPRFRELGVIASMQPYHVVDDGRWAEGRIGAARCASSYAFRSLLDSGAKLALGSDWPIAPVNPFLGIDAAVNRRTIDGKHPDGWFPEQRITVREAIEGYTLGAAYASFQEKERGSVSPGKYADFVILSHDILDPALRNVIGSTQVVATVVGGKIVHDARPASDR